MKLNLYSSPRIAKSNCIPEASYQKEIPKLVERNRPLAEVRQGVVSSLGQVDPTQSLAHLPIMLPSLPTQTHLWLHKLRNSLPLVVAGHGRACP